jgi:cephalosporin-C deacetylase-like acetyl esterase
MVSRRRFLQANVLGLTVPLAGSGTLAQSAPPAVAPVAKRDYWNDWPLYLTAKMNEARARRKGVLASLRTPAQANERLQMIRAKVWELVGGPLEKTPLNPRTGGTIERKAYRIEKVIFESQPQVYVTAHLYVPTAGAPPFPGILAPLGHASNGKAYRNYQYLFQTLARKGYVVLAFDPFGQGERHQYFDPRTGRPRYGPTGEHSQAGRPLLLLGASFAQYRAWDAIRALDYLLSRPEVDATRIGCTGHSGGGTMTMYLCALEPRIQTAVEVQGNSENLAGPDYSPPGAVADAEQNLIGSLAHGLDRGDLLAAFAPKPLLVCYTPQDAGTTYSPRYEEGTREIFDELKNVYGVLGARDKVELFASPLPHDFDFPTRRATYEWFNRWLARGDLGSEEADFETSPAESLNCTTSGEVLTSLGGRSVVQLNADRARAVIPPSPYRDTSVDPAAQRERIRSKLKGLLALPGDRCPLDARILSSTTRRGVLIEEIEFRSEVPVRVPGWFVKPSGTSGPLPVVLHVSEAGKDSIIEEPTKLDALVQRGVAICTVDLRGLGVTAPRFPAAGPLFYGYEDIDIKDAYAWASLTLGKPVLGQRVWDFLRFLDYVETRPEIDRRRIHVVGVGGAGLAVLLGTVLDARPRSLLLQRVIADFRSVVESEEYALRLSWFLFGMLREFDLPDLVASLAPRTCWLLNPVGAGGDALPESSIRSRYEPAADAYARAGASSALGFIVRPDQEWLDSAQCWTECS